jgi:F-type H+-transporting ATPase subunit b
MNAIFYKPITNIIEERNRFINDNELDAQNSSQLADKYLKNREELLSKSIIDAKKLIAEKVNAANETSRSITEQAKQKTKEDMITSKATLLSQVADNETELNSKIEDIAALISTKILGGEQKC